MGTAAPFALTLALVLTLPSRAEAASVSEHGVPGEIGVDAFPGEANRVTVKPEPGRGARILIEDSGAPLWIGKGCRRVTGGAASCAGSFQPLVTVSLGNDDDRLDTAGFREQVTADGGPGDDLLVGPTAIACLNGGPGNDVLRTPGGVRGCIADGDAGDDILVGSKLGEVLSGGPGADWINGAGGADNLSGDAGDDLLRGGTGQDNLLGGGGADELTAGPGHDALLGGAGDDRLRARDGERDTVDCGAGRDITVVDGRDSLSKCG